MFFFFNDTATTEIYTLSLHDALPICPGDEALQVLHRHVLRRYHGDVGHLPGEGDGDEVALRVVAHALVSVLVRSEVHTSELQSRQYLVCRLLLEKKHFYTPSTPSSPK